MTNSVLKTVEVTPTHISCRRESGERCLMAVFALKLTALFLGLSYFFWSISGPLSARSPVEVWAMLVPYGVPLLGLVCVGVMLYCAGPADLIVDTDRRTYRFRRGFSLIARWYEGTLEDVAGLQVLTSRSYKSPTSYKALLHWRNTEGSVWATENGPVRSRGRFQLGASQDEAGVRAEVDSLAQRIGVPVLEQEPFVNQKRGDAILSLILLSFVAFVIVPPLLVNWELDTQGRHTHGVVTTLRPSKEAVHYTYQVAGRSFDGRAVLARSDFDALSVGSQITVLYLPGYPRTSTVQYSQDEANNLAQDFMTLFPVCLLVGGYVLFSRAEAKRHLTDAAMSSLEEQVARRPRISPLPPTFGISPPATDELIQANVLGINRREQNWKQFWTCAAIIVGTALFIWLIVG